MMAPAMDEFLSSAPTEEDYEAVKPIVEALGISWWLKDNYTTQFARAHALGRTSAKIKTTAS